MRDGRKERARERGIEEKEAEGREKGRERAMMQRERGDRER